MNAFEKSEAIKASLRKGFRDGSSKMAKRRCYGYDVASDGALVINSEEAKVVVWIFEQYKDTCRRTVNEIKTKYKFQGE